MPALGITVSDRLLVHVTSESTDRSTNHGGVTVIATPSIDLARVDVTATQLSTFEHICVRATAGQFADIIVAIYPDRVPLPLL